MVRLMDNEFTCELPNLELLYGNLASCLELSSCGVAFMFA